MVVFLRFLVIPALVAAAYFVWRDGPTLGQLPSAKVNALIPAGLEAEKAEQASARIFGSSLLPRIAVVQRDPHGLSLRSQKAIVRHAVRLDEGRLPGFPQGSIAAPYVNTSKLFPAARERSTTAITYLAFPSSVKVTTQRSLAQRYASEVSPLGPKAYATGFIPGNLDQSQSVNDHLRWVTLATLAVIAIIIGVYLRSLVAPLVTLAAAGISWLLATRAVAYLALRTGTTLQQEVEPVVAVLLLGVVTDYSVFFLSGARWRLTEGDRPTRAVRWTVGEYIPIVFTAAWIVALGLATLRVASIGFVQQLGPAMAVVVLTSMAVVATFVPAAIAILGRLAYWPGLRPAGAGIGRRLRGFVVRQLTRKWLAAPATALIVAGLCALGSGIFRTQLGLTPIYGLQAGSPAVRAADAAGRGFAPGIVAPTEIVLRGDSVASNEVALARLGLALDRVPGVAAALGAGDAPDIPVVRDQFRSRSQHAARYLVVLDHDPYGPAGIHDLQRIERRLPSLLRQVGLDGVTASYAGDTAIAAGTVGRIHHDVAVVTAAAFGVNFLLLALFLRALVAPLLLILGSGLALAATFGLTTYVFQGLLGYQGLTYYVPLAVGVLLLSFGSDYNLFVVGRIWQESSRRSTAGAIRAAAPRASRAISVAGLALAFSFACLAIVPLRQFEEFAFGMFVGVLIDTFVVRSYLIPALIALAGRYAWWPSSRGRLARPGLDEAADAID